MTTLQVSYNKTTKTATVAVAGTAVPEGSVDVGSFDHPDPVYPDSLVIFHGVRDLLYRRSEADPSQIAMFPKNITDLQNIKIVQEDLIAVSGVTLAPATASIAVGATQQLTPTIAPADATIKDVTYASSDEAVATVSATGLVTGVAVGSATITVTTTNGAKTAQSVITVTE